MAPARVLGQVACYAAFAAFIGWFSADPRWRHSDPDTAQIKLSFRHAGNKAGECRRLSPEEIAALPANMRKPLDCPRGRVALVVELEVDGVTLMAESLAPSGIAGDGSASAYRRFALAPGEHRIVARLRDSDRTQGFDHEGSTTVMLAPQQNFVVDFESTQGGFQFR